MERQTYENQKMKITDKVSEVMDDYVKDAFSKLDETSVNFMKRLYDGRRNRALNGGRLRDAIVAICLNICGIEELKKDHLRVIAAGEFYNMASYYQNWHLDDKKEVKTDKDKKLCHIASHFFRELSMGIVFDTKFEDRIKLKLLKEISESNRAIQIGQSLELNLLNSQNLNYSDDEKIRDRYLRRCYLFSGRFYGCSFAMAPIMAGKDDEKTNLFREIGILFGTGGQIINDVGDFCLSIKIANLPEKDYQDQFADLEKGTLTLPSYELSKYVNIHEYVGRKLTFEEKQKLLNIMIENKCFDSSRAQTNRMRNEIKRKISSLEKTSLRDELKTISGMFFNNNKFYVGLRKECGYKWVGKYEPINSC
ncbi:MAG: polyprenyl synthetase family protein [Nanoarchaeota archaeon]